MSEVEKLWRQNRNDPKIKEMNRLLAGEEQKREETPIFGTPVQDVQNLNKTDKVVSDE